jgi:malate/lactate dehydrogenase
LLQQSVVICAGASQRPLAQQALDELGLSRRRVIGSAPEALAATARALVALEANTSPAQVMLTVMGRPPDKMVIPWSEASIGGNSVTSMLTATQLRRLDARLFSAFVSLDRDNGTKAPVCAWPVSIGPAGVERVASPQLTGRDRVVIDEVLE